MDLCKYKNALGEPNKGIHSYKFLGISVADVIMTIIGSGLIAYLFKLNFLYTTFLLFITGIILHRVFCVRTTVDKILFPNVKD